MPPSVRMISRMGACCQRVVDHAEVPGMPARPAALHRRNRQSRSERSPSRPCFTHPSPSGTSSSAIASGSRPCASTRRIDGVPTTGTSSTSARARRRRRRGDRRGERRRPRGPHHARTTPGSGTTSRSRRSAASPRFSHEHGAVPGIQLAHAGRKASVPRPGAAAGRVAPEEGGWPPVAPSPLAFDDGWPCRARSTTARSPASSRLRGRRAARARGRLPGARDPRGARLPPARVPLAALNLAQRRLRRRLRRARAAAARGRRGGARRLAGRAPAGRAHLRHRLGRGRLVRSRTRSCWPRSSGRSASISWTARPAATRRRSRSRSARAIRCRSPRRSARAPASRPPPSA